MCETMGSPTVFRPTYLPTLTLVSCLLFTVPPAGQTEQTQTSDELPGPRVAAAWLFDPQPVPRTIEPAPSTTPPRSQVSLGYDRRAVRARGGVSVEHSRAATIINLIIQLIAGAVGGNAAGAASKDISLGTLGNTIAGAVGGVGGGQLLSALIPMMAGAGNNVDIGALASQAVGGGVAGAIVAGIIGLIKNKMAS